MKSKVRKGEKHFCSSVWIITHSKPKKVLLIMHNKFNKWIQPGGHVESFENPIETAIREINEEIGIDISFLARDINVIDKDGKFLPLPQFMLEERIPKYKDVPEHFHIDCHYIVEISEQKINPRILEASLFGWFRKDEVIKLPMHEDTKFLIKKILK